MIGDLDQALRVLEGLVAARVPGCTFFFGDTDEKMREKSPPYVAWYVPGAEEAPPWEQPSGQRFALVDDLTEIRARCAGLVTVPGPDPRRQQHNASKTVLDWLRWAVKTQHQGKDEPLRSWTSSGPELSDAYIALDWTFTVRASLLSPDFDSQIPETQEITEQVQ